MRPLRICLVTTFYPPYHFGGDGVFVYRLAESLAERGHTVHVVHSLDAYHVRTSAEPLLQFAHHPNVTRVPLATSTPVLSALSVHQTGKPAAYMRTLRAHFASHTYDVIHYHNASLMGAPALFDLGDAVKLYTTHEYWLVCPTHVLFKFDREACTSRACFRCTLAHRRPPQLWRYGSAIERGIRAIDAFIMPSRFALDRHRRDGITGDMRVIPHFVPMPDDGAPGELSPTDARPYFLFVGRLEKLKGAQDLLTVFSKYRDADLLIVGTGTYEEELRQRASGLPHVRFLGAMHPSELNRLYRHAIAVMVPSLCFEAFALIAAEAMSHGTPVIGRRIGALEELLVASGGGITFDTLAECEAAMQRLAAHPDERDELGRTGQRFAHEHWTIDAHLTRYFALIEEKLALRASGGRTIAESEPARDGEPA